MFDQLRSMIYSQSFFCVCMLIANGVFGAGAGVIESVSVMEGDYVTLNSNVTEIQSQDYILWMFGPQETRIAEIHKQVTDLSYSNMIFGDRLKIDNQTGSLTIRNITTEHSGLYKLQIISSGTSYMRFSITVYALPTPFITIKSTAIKNSSSLSSTGTNCVLECSLSNKSNVSLSWYKGNNLFSSIIVSDLNNSIYLHLECLDDSYSCVVAYSFTHKTTHVNHTQQCHTCSETVQRSHLILLITAIVLLVLVIFPILMCCHRKCRQMRKKKIQEEIHYAEMTFCTQNLQSKDIIAESQAVYSSIRTF